MENTIKNYIKSTDLNYSVLKSTFETIEQFVRANDYQFKDATALTKISESEFNGALINASKKKRKKLASYVWAINNRPTLSGVNKFFHFLMKTILKSDVRLKVLKSEKELAIQEKRKVYKEALAKAKAAYAEYKTEKGEFYKIRLSKTQSI
jgi:hypothetical protein